MESLFYGIRNLSRPGDVFYMELSLGIRHSILKQRYQNVTSRLGSASVLKQISYARIAPILGWFLRTNTFVRELRIYAPNFNILFAQGVVSLSGEATSVLRVFLTLRDLHRELAILFRTRESWSSDSTTGDEGDAGDAGEGDAGDGNAGGGPSGGGEMSRDHADYNLSWSCLGSEPMEVDSTETLKECGIDSPEDSEDKVPENVGEQNCQFCWKKSCSCDPKMIIDEEVLEVFRNIMTVKSSILVLKDGMSVGDVSTSSKKKTDPTDDMSNLTKLTQVPHDVPSQIMSEKLTDNVRSRFVPKKP